MRCPSCDHENRADRRFCTACGAGLAACCPRCGAASEPGEQFCGGCGARLTTEAPALAVSTPVPQPESALPVGERRQLTVLFCDLVGSTQLSQQLDAEEWRDVLARYQQAASDVVARFGGHVAKNLGDGLLIYFGWPTAREDDPERAVRAGLAIVDALAALGATLSVDNGTRLAVRIGLHTGPAVIADGGEVFGETPNVAARVQSAAEPDTVVITAATQRLVPGIFVLEDRGSQVFKGVREPVPLYRVLQPSGVRSRLDVAAGRLTRFVGREVELATLVDRWERAADGDGQNVLLVGEAGVGKSRLAYQLRERLVAVPHTWLECGASPYTEGTPFHPVVALVAQGLAFTATDKATEKVEKITRGLRDLATPESVNLLADFLGLPPPTPLALNPDVQRRKTMELLAQWNLAISAVQPLVLLVEDLHWCDASSLELLGRIIAQSATARVLFLATTRPEFTSLWPARSNLTTLRLTRLTKRHAREMVTTLLGATVPAETLEALVARADGVPLYVEELTKAVAELGAARGADAIPSTLAGSLMARLDRLATAKEVAQRAAVLGREFSYPLLAAVAGMEEAGLRQGLARLVDAEIVFQRGEPPEATYTFKHALVQEAAYESLLRSTRAQCHRRVGVVLAERFPEIAEGEPELLAQHFHAAGMAAEAVEYWRQAGLKAVQRSPNEASRHLERAVETLGTLPESPERDQLEIELLTALGPALLATRGFTAPEVGRNYERAHDLCRRTGDTPQLFATLWGLWLFNTNQGRLRMAREISERAMGLAQQQGDKGLLLQAHHMLGATLLSLGPLTSSRSHWEAGIALYDPSEHRGHASLYGGHDPGVCCRGFGAHAIWMLGYADLALQRTRDAILLAQTLGQPASLAHALISAAMLHRLRREPHSALDMVQVGLTVSTEHHLALYETSLRFIQGWAMAKTGRENEGIAGIHGARAVLKDAGVTVLFGMSFSGIIAEACLEAGQLEAGLAALDEGLAMAEASGELSFLSELKRLRGELLLEHGGAAAEEAAICLRSALDMARAQEAKSFELRAATSLARLWRDQGKRAEAHELLGPVYAWFTEGFDTRDLIEAKALLDELR